MRGLQLISLLLVWAFMSLNSVVCAQRITPLNQANQDKIAEYEELVDGHIASGKLTHAVAYLNQIATIYWQNGRPDQAAQTFLRAAPLYERLNDQENLQRVFSNVGLIYMDMEDISGARQAFERSLQVRRRINDKRGLSSGLVDLAYVEARGQDYERAIQNLEEALKHALDANFESILPVIYQQLASSYSNIGNVRKGDEFRQKYNDIRNYLQAQTMRGEFQQRETRSQAETRRAQAEVEYAQLKMQLDQIMFREAQDSIALIVRAQEDSLLLARRLDSLQRQNILILEQDAMMQEIELEKQKAVQNFQMLIIQSAVAILAMGLILIIIMFRNNQIRKRINKKLAAQNELIEEQNLKITQSISYAREIQRALLPPVETLQHYIPESFIFFEPVQMVSGDFYWFREIDETSASHQTPNPFLPIQGNKFLLAAVDCTGHGVPGAFMSMIGYNLLDSITQRGIVSSELILAELHKGVRKALKQDEGENRDGMDLSLCVIDKEQRSVQFSGANNPVLYIQDGQASIIKGDRYSIGGSQREEERFFEAHTIQVDKPTWFYIFSDGYTDQFGGPQSRKFLLKNLKKLLEEIHQKPMQEQGEILRKTLFDWMGSKDNQIDDVVLIGFKLG